MEALLTPEEVAGKLKLTPHTVYAWLRQGKLRGVKLGRVWRIKPEDLQTCVQDSHVSAPSGEEAGAIDGMELVRMAEEYMSHVPPEEFERLPRDLSINHDHYLYGCKKRWEG